MAKVRGSETEPKKFAFLGYEVGGWGALLAFLISVVTLMLTAVDRWFLEAQPILRTPEMINLSCQKFAEKVEGKDSPVMVCKDSSKLFVSANPITLINDTSSPHSFTAMSSQVQVSFNSEKETHKSLLLDWHYFNGNQPVYSFSVQPLTSVSKQIEYYPRRGFNENGEIKDHNFMLYRDFENLIASGAIKSITMEFRVELMHRGRLTEQCVVPVDEAFLNNAKLSASRDKPRFELYARACYSRERLEAARS